MVGWTFSKLRSGIFVLYPHWGPAGLMCLSVGPSLCISVRLSLCTVVHIAFWQSCAPPVIDCCACGRRPRVQIPWVVVQSVCPSGLLRSFCNFYCIHFLCGGPASQWIYWCNDWVCIYNFMLKVTSVFCTRTCWMFLCYNYVH